MDSIFEIAGHEMQDAINFAPYDEFRKLSKKIYNIIYRTRRLSQQDREILRKSWHYYLDNILFKEDTEYVKVDYSGKLYGDYESVDKFYRTGYRWKRTQKMLFETDWMWYNGSSFMEIKAKDFRPSFFEAQEKEKNNNKRRIEMNSIFDADFEECSDDFENAILDGDEDEFDCDNEYAEDNYSDDDDF